MKNDWLFAPLLLAVYSLAVIATIVFTFLILTFFTALGSEMQAQSRCWARGYKTEEVIVHFPNFWDVDTYCYGENASNKGVKL
jgi:hypothetical protein